MIELTQAEAEAILKHALTKQGVSFDTFDLTLRLNAVVGVIVAVTAMQELGWRIAKPLELVENDHRPPTSDLLADS